MYVCTKNRAGRGGRGWIVLLPWGDVLLPFLYNTLTWDIEGVDKPQKHGTRDEVGHHIEYEGARPVSPHTDARDDLTTRAIYTGKWTSLRWRVKRYLLYGSRLSLRTRIV